MEVEGITRPAPRAEFEISRGFFWPVGTREAIKDLIDKPADVEAALTFTKKRRVVVQAGGNVGCWPRYLAARFERVYTFEPEPSNFSALALNIQESNVCRINAALGDVHGCVGLRISPKNIGAHSILGAGMIPTFRIDDLALDLCDLIALDVEGFEFPAVRGAEKTLMRHSPVLMIEDRQLGEKKNGGGSFAAIADWLRARGYAECARVNWDVVFTREKKK